MIHGFAMAVTLDQFVQNLTDSGLMSVGEVAAFRENLLTAVADGETLAKLLVRQKKLTKYQATAVYQGKIKHLTFGEYVVTDKIGAGGMGLVLKARHRRMDRDVAVKVLPAKAMKDDAAEARFYQEVKAAAKLIHTNIVVAFEAGENEGLHYLIMEYVDGRDLAAIVHEHGPLPVEEAVECVRQAAQGLQYAHDKGIVHRDIKPGNLLLAKDGTVKILDMGLARLNVGGLGEGEEKQPEQLTQSGQIMGTVDYMAPEQAEDTRTADHRADIYALGCTLFRLVTGEPVYQRDTIMQKLLAHREDVIPSMLEYRHDVPARLVGIFQRMVAKNPDERYQSMTEVIAALDTAFIPSPQAAKPAPKKAESSSSMALTEFFQHIGDQKVATKQRTAIGPEETIDRAPSAEDTGDSIADVEPVGWTAPANKLQRKRRPLVGNARPTKIWIAGGGALLAIVLFVVGIVALFGPSDSNNVDLAGGNNGEGPTDDPEFAAAKWALQLGGDIWTDKGNFTEIRQLPEQPFRVLAIHLPTNRMVTDQDLVHLEGLTQLSRLSLHGNSQISDAGLKYCERLTTLTQIDLHMVQITDMGLRHISRLTKLTKLVLNDTKVTDSGLEQIKGMANLKSLELKNTDVSDASFEILAGFRQLDTLDLSKTKVTAACIAKLKIPLPNCNIVSSISNDEIEAAIQQLKESMPPMARAPFSEQKAKEYQEAWAKYLGVEEVEQEIVLPGGEKLTMVLIPPGEFMMGSTAEEQAKFLEEAKADNDRKDGWAVTRIPDETPQHPVRITKPFYLGKYEVTQAQWLSVMGNNPSWWKDNPTHPVETVSWDDIQPFLANLNEGSSGKKLTFVLPTEAQWEFACRAGTTTPYYGGESADDVDQYGWSDPNSGGKTHPVGKLKPNAFGLYDMQGNVWEWCADLFAKDYYDQAPVDDPSGPSAGLERAFRGGGWSYGPWRCRSAYRDHYPPHIRSFPKGSMGFRLAAEIVGAPSVVRE